MHGATAAPHDSPVNLVIRGTAEILGLVLALLTTVWVSRTVGPTYFGYFAVMTTLIQLGSILVNAGLSTAGSQRVANGHEPTSEIWWVLIVARACVAAGVVGLTVALLVLATIDPVLRSYLAVGLIVWILVPMRTEWLLVAQARLGAVSVVRIAGSSASAVVAFAFVRGAGDYGAVPWVPVASALVAAVTGTILARQTARVGRPSSPFSLIREYLRAGLHYLKSDASIFVFTSSDRLFLYVFATPAVVGLYEAAYRVIQPFYTISAVVGDTMYLQLARAFGTDQLRPTFRRYVDLMCFATIPLGFFLLAFAPYVIAILYGPAFAGAADYLAILGWVITFGYTSGIAVIPFTAWNRPREYGNATAFGGAINLVLNVALIPRSRGSGPRGRPLPPKWPSRRPASATSDVRRTTRWCATSWRTLPSRRSPMRVR